MSKLINCKTCGKEIAKSAKKCPHCGAKNVAPLGQRILAVAIVFIVIVFIVALNQGDDEPTAPASGTTVAANAASTTRATTTTEPPVEYIEVTAAELLEAYDANGVAADAKYKDKMLKVTGVVGSIDKDILDNAYVTLKSDDEFSFVSVQCYFDKKNLDSIAALASGETITIAGKCEGSSLNVVLKKCGIVD